MAALYAVKDSTTRQSLRDKNEPITCDDANGGAGEVKHEGEE